MPTPSPATAYTVTPYNAVILREVAVSIVECQGHWRLRLLRWHAQMDSATSRGMTKLGFGGYFGNDGRASGMPTPSPATAYTVTPYNTVTRHRTHCHATQRRHPPPHTPSRHTTPSPATAYAVTPYNAVTRHRIHRHAIQRRHTARSRSIHSGVPRPLASPAAALACKDGFRDFARNDEVGGSAGTSGMTAGPPECQRHHPPPHTPSRHTTPSPATAHAVTPHNAVTRHRTHRHAIQRRHPPPHTPSRHTTPSYCAKSQYP